MGMSVNSGNTSVTGVLNATIGLPAPNSSQSLITVTGTGSGSSQNVYTVTAGKKFYLMSVLNNAAQTGHVEVRNHAGSRIGYLSVVNGQSADSVWHGGGSPIAVYQASEIVKVLATSGQIYTIVGFEQ